MRTSFAVVAVLCTLVAGCSGSAGLTTGSLFGGDDDPVPAAQPADTSGDPTSRAFQVGSVAARATKCGYNFDAAKLKADFLTAEAARGASPDIVARSEKVYDIAYNGVWKGVAQQKDYCTAKRTREVKADLTRHLAGDYTARHRQVAKESGGLFTDWANPLTPPEDKTGIEITP